MKRFPASVCRGGGIPPARAWLALFVLVTSVCAQDFLTGPRNTFEVHKRAMGKAFREKQAAAGDQYIQTLEALITRMENAGDEFGVRPAQAEIKRFRSDRSVPQAPPVGTPEMIGKVQERYHAIVAAAKSEEEAQVKTLSERYVKALRGVEQKLKAKGRVQDAAAAAEEIRRVSGGSDEALTQSLSLPKKYAGNLMCVYTFEEKSGRRIRDLTGRRHGDLQGAKPVKHPEEGAAYAFSADNDMMEVEHLNLAGSWTLLVRARFPLKPSKDPRVLLSHGYKLHQVVVDVVGELGVESGGFASSGFSVNELKGWHEVAVVASFNRTLFYIDGKPAGAAHAICAKPMKVFGNSAAGGRPWKGEIASILLWRGSMSTAEIHDLYQHRYGTP